jgi:ABC-type Na+ efflux pump permease subunit
MRILLMVLLGLAMAGVLGVLAAGMFGLVRGGDPARSNRLMQWRVALQAAALILFALLVLLFRS